MFMIIFTVLVISHKILNLMIHNLYLVLIKLLINSQYPIIIISNYEINHL